MFNVLTGFKFIAEKIQEFEEKHNHTYMMGFEESFGYLIKPFVRDKDAIQAVLVVAELAAYYRSRGLTLAERYRRNLQRVRLLRRKNYLCYPFRCRWC